MNSLHFLCLDFSAESTAAEGQTQQINEHSELAFQGEQIAGSLKEQREYQPSDPDLLMVAAELAQVASELAMLAADDHGQAVQDVPHRKQQTATDDGNTIVVDRRTESDYIAMGAARDKTAHDRVVVSH